MSRVIRLVDASELVDKSAGFVKRSLGLNNLRKMAAEISKSGRLIVIDALTKEFTLPRSAFVYRLHAGSQAYGDWEAYLTGTNADQRISASEFKFAPRVSTTGANRQPVYVSYHKGEPVGVLDGFINLKNKKGVVRTRQGQPRKHVELKSDNTMFSMVDDTEHVWRPLVMAKTNEIVKEWVSYVLDYRAGKAQLR